MLNGIDISHWQAGINLAAVPADFVIMKATGGVSYVSGDCDRQFQQAKQVGRLRGVYHFANDDSRASSAEAEADFFVNHTLGYHDGETLLVLDWEAQAIPLGVAWAKRWLDRVHERTGIKPLIYMSQSVTTAHDWSSVVVADYGLWVAAYGQNPQTGYRQVDPPNVGYWPFAAILQYGSRGRLTGYPGDLDVNRAYMDRAGWLAYAAISRQPAPTPDPSPEPTPEPESSFSNYTVVAGDTLSGVASRFGTTWQQLAASNLIVDPNLIRPGQILKVPSGTPARIHIITRGETLTSIAALYGTTVAAIAAANGLTNPNLIYAGNKLRIP